jgi:site-specific DNA recombinase
MFIRPPSLLTGEPGSLPRKQVTAATERQLNIDSQQHSQIASLAISIEDFVTCVRGSLEQASFEQKRQLVKLLIDQAIVTDDKVEIRYVIPTTPASEQVRFCHLRTDYLVTI